MSSRAAVTDIDLRAVCRVCIDEGKLTRVAIYSRTLCTEHADAHFDRVLASATPEEWATAWERVFRDEQRPQLCQPESVRA